jgi:hypothetical protein
MVSVLTSLNNSPPEKTSDIQLKSPTYQCWASNYVGLFLAIEYNN